MLKLRINPIVAKDLKNIQGLYCRRQRGICCEKTIKERFMVNLKIFRSFREWDPIFSKRVSFRTDYKYAIWEDYVIIYKIGKEYVEVYRVVNRYQDITRIFE